MYKDNRIIILRSDKDTHFTGSLSENAGELEALTITATQFTNEFVIEQISIISNQNLEWDLFIWSSSIGPDTSDYDDDTYIEYQNFPKTTGKQIGGAGGFYYSASDIKIPYRDDDIDERANGSVHCTLVNRSSTSKNAGATGEVVVVMYIRPIYEGR